MVRTTEWAFCVETVLGGYGLVTHLIGTCPTATSDGSNSAAITTWLNDDGRVKSAIVTSMKPSLMMSLQPYKTAKEMWDYLQKRYVQVSGAHLHTLMQGLRGLQQDELSIDDYYAAFDCFMGPVLSMVPASTAACEGCSKKTKFIEQFLMYQFVMGLRSEFEPVRAQLLNQTVSPSMSDVLASLTAEETRLRSLSPARSVLAPHSVLAAPQKAGIFTSSPFPPCEHCKKPTRRSENCFIKYPEKLADYRSRRSARACGTTPKGSVSVAAASPVGTSQSSWVLDSGASFHVTSDHSQLVDCRTVHDGTSVQTADGTPCSITHQGSLSNSHFFVPHVSLVPQLSMNLLSVGQITDQNCFIGFDDSSCFIQDRRSGTVIETGHRRRDSSNIYILDTLRLPSSAASTAHASFATASSASSFAKWHHRLGHLCGSRLSTLISSGCLGHVSIES